MKIKSVFALILLLILSINTQASDDGPGISRTKHNLSPRGAEVESEQICYWCHTPHMTYGSDAEGPKWSREASTEAFRMYKEAPTGEADPDSGEDVLASSPSVLVCLGCHDGVTAPNRLIMIPKASDSDTSGLDPLASSLAVSQVSRYQDRPVEHPVFVNYKTGGKAKLRDPESSLMHASGLDWGRSKNIKDLLRNGKVECVSCHDPHVENPLFLRASGGGVGSKLCFGCHNK